MNAPLVSILIPCHNAAPFLGATLESALAQTHPRCEIIVVDDGSSDGSLAIARSFEPRIRVIAGPRKGASAARNSATAASRGEWLQYLDADDLLLPDAVARRLEALAAAGADVACSDWRRLVRGADGAWCNGAHESGDPKRFSDEADLAVMKGFWAPPAAILYGRPVAERTGGWHPGLPVIQDARFLFEAVRRGGRIVHVASEDAHYRQHGENSLSSASAAAFWKDVLANTCEIDAMWRAEGVLTGERRAAVAGSYALGARQSFSADAALFHAYLERLDDFPELRRSKYLKAAVFLDRLFGHRAARRMIGIMHRMPPKG